MKNDCLFCAIIDGEIPSNKVYEDEQCYAFYDIDPQAPTHFLVVPKEHICCANAITADNSGVVAHCFEVIVKICKELGVADCQAPALPCAGRPRHDVAPGLSQRRTAKKRSGPQDRSSFLRCTQEM